MKPIKPNPSTSPGLPLVVQLGFAGSRQLYDPQAYPDIDEAAFHVATCQLLTERLALLPKELGVAAPYFFCGLSQLAIGADTLFTQACAQLGWQQRLFLPQQLNDFLAAKSTHGIADFTKAQRQQALQLIASPHIIEQQVLSIAADRHARFHQVNVELVKHADVLVCLLRADAISDKLGGTFDLLAQAELEQKKVLVLYVGVGENGQPVFLPKSAWTSDASFHPPTLPQPLLALPLTLSGIPCSEDFSNALKTFCSEEAKHWQFFFKSSAFIIILTHVIATLLALLGLKLHEWEGLSLLFILEITLLLVGFGTHHYLHRSHAAKSWAFYRLLSVIASSALALSHVPGQLTHLFSLPIHRHQLLALLNTLNVIHLRDVHQQAASAWQSHRDDYVNGRLDGQIRYYQHKASSAKCWHTWASRIFTVGSFGALIATTVELLEAFHKIPEALLHEWHAIFIILPGFLAIFLPVVAVAALSLAASFDLEAREHTYEEMLQFLIAKKARLQQAKTQAVFSHIALEIEQHLLAETANWYSRRAFTGVA